MRKGLLRWKQQQLQQGNQSTSCPPSPRHSTEPPPPATHLEEVWALVGAGGHQQASVGTALDGQPPWRAVAGGVQVLSTGLEVVKDVLEGGGYGEGT